MRLNVGTATVACMTTGRAGRRDGERFLRFYAKVCLVGAVIGVAATVWAFSTGPKTLGWTFAVLTLLMLPAYLLNVWAARRSRP
jgi:hypothetical protein